MKATSFLIWPLTGHTHVPHGVVGRAPAVNAPEGIRYRE